MSSEVWERQRRSFENTAEAYDRFRPTYPKELFDDVRAYANLSRDDRLLEIGTGTGKATPYFAAWGNPVVAAEPAPAMADRARANLAGYVNVDIRIARFEDVDEEPGSFGLVTCAQVWHWLDPDTRIGRIANLLRPRGTAAIIANVQVVPPHNLAFWERVQNVYIEHTPGMEHQGAFRTADDLPEHPLEGSDLFSDLEQAARPWHWTLGRDDYLGLCATHSNKAALDDRTREKLLSGIRELIDAEFDGHVTEYYVAMAGLARRV